MDSVTQRDKVLRPRQVRGANSGVVLKLLRRHERLSRAELARHSGLSEGTVSRIVGELIERHLVMEDGVENSTGGRPSTPLRLEHRFAMGADVRDWGTRFALGTMRGGLVEITSRRTPRDSRATLDLIAEQYGEYRKRFDGSRLEGVGVSVRGIVDSRTGVVELGSDPGWVKIPVKEYLESALHVPVYVENNVRAAAIGEYNFGSQGTFDRHCILFVVVDEGVGIGIVIDGKLHHGPRMAAGEFGQMVIQDSNSAERYDRPGCLEKLASTIALCNRYAALTKTKAFTGSGSVASRGRVICHRAMEGDEMAKAALLETARYLGIGISNVVWGLDADMVMVSSIMTLAWPLVGPVILDQFPEGGQTVNRQNLLIRPSALGDEAALTGAATLPFNRVFAGESTHLISAAS